MKRKIAILGSTGSIGLNALELVKQFNQEIEVIGLSTFKNIDALQKQIREFKPKLVAVRDEKSAKDLKKRTDIEVYAGLEGIKKIAAHREVDIVIIGISGSEALQPLLSAIRASKKIALANKEALVMAGRIIMQECVKYRANLIPVDSEQSAIFQCIENQPRNFVDKLYITSSGGPLIDTPREDFLKVKPEQAIKHPRWKMGKKISVDSATLMNKALEVIEARWLFDMDWEKIKVVIHREAIVHSMVEFIDGAIFAQLGVTDMKLPILYAISYPERWASPNSRLDIAKLGELHFEAPDFSKFQSLSLAYKVLKLDGTVPCVLNAANEKGVEAFLGHRLSFDRIVGLVNEVIDAHLVVENPSIEEILSADEWARKEADKIIEKQLKDKR